MDRNTLRGKGSEGCGPEEERRFCRRRHWRIVYISIWGIMLLLHAVAWSSKRFCDWYAAHVYGIWVDTYGRAMGRVPFSVGEILIGFGVVFGAVGAVLGVLWMIGSAAAWCAGGQRRKGTLEELQGKKRKRLRAQGESPEKEREQSRESEANQRIRQTCFGQRTRLGRFARFAGAYCRAGLWIFLGAFVLMTLNCYILYHGSGFSGTYLTVEERNYTLEELAALRNFVVEQCNALCCQIPRNGDGSLSYEGDMLETAKAAMKHLGETYEGLSGFYPTPKPLFSSDFMSQQYVAGCFYPFSMEANYNDVMYVMNLPSTLCHELGHLKGYVLEDEANLIGYLACVQSEDIFFRYSGYLSVLYYVDNDFRQALESGAGLDRAVSWQSEAEALHEGETQEWQKASYSERTQEQQETSCPEKAQEQQQDLCQVQILPQVHADNIFLTAQERTRIERETFLDTEAVDAISDSIADTSLKLNGVQDGMISYSRVVELLLRYYEIHGYP